MLWLCSLKDAAIRVKAWRIRSLKWEEEEAGSLHAKALAISLVITPSLPHMTPILCWSSVFMLRKHTGMRCFRMVSVLTRLHLLTRVHFGALCTVVLAVDREIFSSPFTFACLIQNFIHMFSSPLGCKCSPILMSHL